MFVSLPRRSSSLSGSCSRWPTRGPPRITPCIFLKPGPFTGSPSDQPVIHVVLVVLAYFLRFSLRVIFTTLRVFTSGFLPTLISDFRNTRSPALDLLPQRNDSSPSHSKTLCTEVCVLLLIRATTSTNIIWHFLYVYSCLCYFLVSCHVKLKVLEKWKMPDW